MIKNELNYRIYLKESSLNNFYEVFHKFAENFIFFKWMFFKNRPRTTFLLLRASLVNALVFGLYYALFSNIQFLLLGIELDPILFFATGCVIGYWNMSSSFAQKTNYLSQMYNDVIKELGHHNHTTSKILACNFTTQLLTMDMWGHRLYSRLFIKTLSEAAHWSIEKKQHHSFTSFAEFVHAANTGKLEVSIAREMILDYQEFLTESSKMHEEESAA